MHFETFCYIVLVKCVFLFQVQFPSQEDRDRYFASRKRLTAEEMVTQDAVCDVTDMSNDIIDDEVDCIPQTSDIFIEMQEALADKPWYCLQNGFVEPGTTSISDYYGKYKSSIPLLDLTCASSSSSLSAAQLGRKDLKTKQSTADNAVRDATPWHRGMPHGTRWRQELDKADPMFRGIDWADQAKCQGTSEEAVFWIIGYYFKGPWPAGRVKEARALHAIMWNTKRVDSKSI